MGASKEHPRYNIVTFRLSDEEIERLLQQRPQGKSLSEFVRALVIAGSMMVAQAGEKPCL